MQRLELIATTGFGLEAVVSRELKQLGYSEQTVEDGKVTFVGDEAAVCRANLWLRSAERVLVKVGAFEARDFGELFDRTKSLAWPDWLPADAQFPVRGKSVRSRLHSVPDCQAIVKKAIVERLKETYKRSWFDETGPACAVEVSLLKDKATLAIDTSGRGLHKRGYRRLVGEAPLKETLAAALVQLSFWKPDRPLIDPFCGSGTIPIEAALIGRNLAPGAARSFAAEDWPRLPRRLWEEARTEARDRATGRITAPLVGSDIDEKAISLARHHAREAGVDAEIQFSRIAFQDLTTSHEYGCLICNPPYGERLGDRQAAEAIYRDLPQVFAKLGTWSFYVLTSNPLFERCVGRQADRRRKLYNGRIECTYYQFAGPRPPRANQM